MKKSKTLGSLAVISLFLLAQVPFSLAKWTAVAEAPEQTGNYNVIVEAIYKGKSITFPLNLTVSDVTYPRGTLSVEPIYPIPRDPPIDLRYDITLNNTNDFDMIWNKVDVFYTSDNAPIVSQDMALEEGDDGYWHVIVDPPLKGDYKAVVSLIVEKDDTRYGGDFITHFTSNSMSTDLVISTDVENRVLATGEKFDVYLTAVFNGTELTSLGIAKAYLQGITKTLSWDANKHRYVATLTAPPEEGIYPMSIYLDGQDFVVRDKIYVANTGDRKSARCPLTFEELGTCGDVRDVRKCVKDYKDGDPVLTEGDLISCFGEGGVITEGSIVCSKDKGDFDGDGYLDIDDVDVMQNLILPMEDVAREEFKGCADYNNDGEVNEDDLTCLGNVVAGKWYGDFNGGICFDADYDAPMKGDLDGDGYIRQADADLMDKLIEAEQDNHINISSVILDAADFDQNNHMNDRDKQCLMYFMDMDFSKSETLLGFGQSIPDDCLNIYHFSNCQTTQIKGDLNGDYMISDLDLVAMNLVYRNQVPSSLEGAVGNCADVDGEAGVTEDDVKCVAAYLDGDRDRYFTCIGCDENTPREYRETYEICNDGYDNNCDGYVDHVYVDPNNPTSADYCDCSDVTPCGMVKDADQGTNAGINDANVMVCRKVSWSAESGLEDIGVGGDEYVNPNELSYKWYTPKELVCTESRECEQMRCNGNMFVCAYDGVEWNWYSTPKKMPQETADPNAKPKLCDDDYDNDCVCGDEKCEKTGFLDMLGTGQFWEGAAIGAAGAFLGGPVIAMALSLGGTVGGMASNNPEASALFSGIGIGAMLGGMAGAETVESADVGKYVPSAWEPNEVPFIGVGSPAGDLFGYPFIEAAASKNTLMWAGAIAGVAAIATGSHYADIVQDDMTFDYATEEEWDAHLNRTCD